MGLGMGGGGGNMDRMGSAGPGLLDLPSSMSGMQGGGFKSERRSDAILVRNLPLDCTWQMLKDKFYSVGDIKYAEMKDRGVGVIRFGNERDAERAVSMLNNQRVDGKNILVSFY